MTDQAGYVARGSAARVKGLGITEHVTPLRTVWTGELRVRFSDFQVNEIGKDGQVIHLRTAGLENEPIQGSDTLPTKRMIVAEREKRVPPEGEENAARSEPEPKKEEPIQEVPPEDFEALVSLAGQGFAQGLVDLYIASQTADADKSKTVTSEPIDDRQKRGQIHQEIRRIFQSKIETGTDSTGALTASIVQPRRGKNRGRRGEGRGRGREEPPTGEYLHFTLYKDNRDTLDAVNQVARLLRVKPQVINYAGTKDRRASTVQRCSVRYQRQRALAGVNGKLWGVVTGDYAYRDSPIYLGDLSGNEFTITIKGCQLLGGGVDAKSTSSEKLAALQANAQPALEHMTKHGWINYFGHQRFGTHEIGTHEIGKLLLGQRFEEAVASILSYKPDIAELAEKGDVPTESSTKEDYARHHACMLFMTGKDTEKALQILPRRFSAENSIMRHLTKQGKRDFHGAIIFITRGLRTMYLHAYQSYVWNHVASKRWEIHGAKVVPGDLVLLETRKESTSANDTRNDQDGHDIIDDLDDDNSPSLEAHALTEEEVASGQYTIYDVVLPSPGHDVIYPINEIGVFYKDFMGREENGSLDPHNMRRLHREFSLPGRYRKLMNRFLAEPSIEFRTYMDETEQMHPTDLDVIRAKAREERESKKRLREEASAGADHDDTLTKKTKVDEDVTMESEQVAANIEVKAPVASTTDTPGETASPAVVETKGEEAVKVEQVAAIVKFQLGRSAYATVALRELMGESI